MGLLTLAVTVACTTSQRSAAPVTPSPLRTPSASSPTPSTTSGGGPAYPPPNILRWPYTGSTSFKFEGRTTLDSLAYKAFARAKRLEEDQVVAGGPIWAGVVHDGQRLVVVQTWSLEGGPTHTVIYADRVGGAGHIVGDLTLAADTKAFTVLVPGRRPWRVIFRRGGAQIRPA